MTRIPGKRRFSAGGSAPFLAPLALALGALCTHTACEDPSYLFTGARYDEARDCMYTTSEALDVMAGSDPGDGCALVCLAGSGPFASGADGGSLVYLTTTCPAYPVGYSATGTDPRCAKAFAARTKGRKCLVDGGVSPELDAGAPIVDASGVPVDDAGVLDANHD